MEGGGWRRNGAEMRRGEGDVGAGKRRYALGFNACIEAVIASLFFLRLLKRIAVRVVGESLLALPGEQRDVG